MYLYCYGNRNGVYQKFNRTQSQPLLSQWNMGENDTNFLLPHFFLMPKKDETFLRHHNVKIKIMSYFISINYFMMLWTGRIKFKFQGLS